MGRFQVVGIEITVFEDETRDTQLDRLLRPTYRKGAKVRSEGYVLKIHTQAGITGLFLSLSSYPIAREVVHELRVVGEHLLLGTDAMDRERIWHEIWYAERYSGGEPRSQGPIDIALWDIAGKAAGMSVCQLLGQYRDRIRAYASVTRADAEADGLSSPEAYADFALALREEGFTAIKIHGFGQPDRDVAICRMMRTAVGENVDLMLDPTAEYDEYQALRVGRVLDELGFYWFEDPLPDFGFNVHAYKQLLKELKVPLSLGDMLGGGLYTRVPLLEMGVPIIRTDVHLRGGITGTVKLGRLCEAYGARIGLHMGGPAKIQCHGALANADMYEVGLLHPRFLHHGQLGVGSAHVKSAWESVDDKGYVRIPDDPGIGFGIDEDYVRAHEVTTYRFGRT